MVDTVRQNGCKDLTLLKCISSYLAILEELNLSSILHMRELLSCNVGII